MRKLVYYLLIVVCVTYACQNQHKFETKPSASGYHTQIDTFKTNVTSQCDDSLNHEKKPLHQRLNNFHEKMT